MLPDVSTRRYTAGLISSADASNGNATTVTNANTNARVRSRALCMETPPPEKGLLG
jgi:hypothetical protein